MVLMVGLMILLVSWIAEAETAVPQAIPYQAGFPRSDATSTIEFGSPAVVDINGDGEKEVLTGDGSGCVWAWSENGKVLPGFPLKTAGACGGTPRINGPLAIGDVDGDGAPEIVAGTRGQSNTPGERGKVFVWKANGSLLTGWPQEMDWNTEFGNGIGEVYTVALANVTGDERLEVIAGTSNNGSSGGGFDADTRNLYVWHSDGSIVSGYPTWYRTAGIWGFVGAADLVGDAHAEVIVGRDQLYIHAYDANGQSLSNWPVQTYLNPAETKWGEDNYVEFTRNAPAMADLEGDGVVDIVIAGKVRDPLQDHDTTNTTVLVLQPNGQRKAGWTVPPLGGPPVASSFSPSQAPALADLDDDGELEIIVTLMDGTVRAYRANGSLLWQYDYALGKPLFASEPVVGDVTGDGEVDIIFGTYSPAGSADSDARLHGLNAAGEPLTGFPLPLTHEGNSDEQGIRAAPTLADLVGDCDVEVLAASQAHILYVWDLPAAYSSSLMPWPTGRQNIQRTGSLNESPADFAVNSSLSLSGLSYNTYLPVITTGCN
jgi:hypothetical protein